MPELSIDRLLLFFFCVAPGVVAIQVYSLKCPRTERNWSNSFLEVLTYSAINLTIWGPIWVFDILQKPFATIHKAELFLAMLLVCFISPAVMALLWFQWRCTWLHSTCRLDHPTPKAWDYYIKNYREFFILFHAKNGDLFGGYFGSKSYASTYPHEEQLYVEEVWRVSKKGKFLEKVEGTLGCVVRPCDYERLEFHAVVRE